MAQTIDENQVRHVAKLARLKLNEKQVAYFASQLSDVLQYVRKLEELNVDDVEPMAHPTDITNRFRGDEPGRPLAVEQVLANAPDAAPPFFKVPKVLDEGSGA